MLKNITNCSLCTRLIQSLDKILKICYNILAGEKPAGHESWQGFSALIRQTVKGGCVRKSLTIAAMLVLAVVFMASTGPVFAAPYQDTGQSFAPSPLGASSLSQVSSVGDQEALIVSAPNAGTTIDPGQIALVSAAVNQYFCATTQQDQEVVLSRDYSSRVVVSPMNIGPGSSTPRQSLTLARASDPYIGTLAYDVPQDRGSPGPVAQDLVVVSTRSHYLESTVLRC